MVVRQRAVVSRYIVTFKHRTHQTNSTNKFSQAVQGYIDKRLVRHLWYVFMALEFNTTVIQCHIYFFTSFQTM